MDIKNDLLNKLKEELEKFKSSDDIEMRDVERFLNFITNSDNIYSRKNLTGHICSTACVVNKDRSKLLLLHHNIYNRWSLPGGHNDEDRDSSAVALKEVEEESGLKRLKLVSEKFIAVKVFTVNEHMKKGKMIPTHFHFDVIYLIEADESEILNGNDREVSAVKWFSLDELKTLDSDIQDLIITLSERAQKFS